MRWLLHLMALAILAASVGLSGCSAEEAGEEVDEAVEEVDEEF